MNSARSRSYKGGYGPVGPGSIGPGMGGFPRIGLLGSLVNKRTTAIRPGSLRLTKV